MIIRKILVVIFLLFFCMAIFFMFLWEIPDPTKKIEKNLDVHRFIKNDKN